MARRRNFDALSEAQLAAGRMASRRVGGLASFRPVAAKPVADLLDAIAHVTEAATGERSFLHLPTVTGDKPAAKASDRTV